MSKFINSIVAAASSAMLTIAGVNFVHNEKTDQTNRNYCVIRSDVPPNVQSAVDWSVMIANDDSYGYDPDRTRDHDFDCSELVIEAYKQAGFNVGEATYTGNMKRVFEANGFEVLDYYAGMPLQIGDVFLNETYHTEMLVGYYDDGIGKNVGAHDDFNGVSGDSDVDYDGVGDEIDFGEYTEYTSVHPWQYVLRYKAYFYDWLQIPDYENDFYAFIESDNTVLASYNDVLFMETETGNPEEVWHFVKEDNNRFTISNGSYSGSYNLYKDDTGAIILHEVGSERSCLTSVSGTVINTEYDSCSEEQRFRIRPVSDPILVTYDYFGTECPIRKEHYNQPYSFTIDLEIIEKNGRFLGWYTSPEGGEKIDSKVMIPYSHTLYAHFDAVPEDTAKKGSSGGGSSGGGRHDNEPTTESKTDEVAYDEDIVIPQDHSIYNPNIVTPDSVQYTPEPETEKSEIQVESINLNRYSKTLNTVGNSTSFTLNAEVSPSTAQNKNIHYESSNSSVCRVERNTGRIYAVSDGKCTIKAIADNGVSASCEVTVSTKYTTKAETVPVTTYKNVPESYDMECYCGRTIESMVRQFYDHDISNQYDALGLSRAYGQWHHQWTFTAAEVDAAARISPGQQQGGSQNGTNASSATGYSMLTMSGSTWFDHKNQTGGGAIKFMQYFYGMSFSDAVQNLLGYTVSPLARNLPETALKPKKEFILPPKNATMNRVYAYLIKQRYIAPDVVSFFAKEGKIYEDAEHHNAVFVGFDENGIPRQAHKRSTNSYGKTFRITVEGSDTDYSFAHYGTSGRLYVFEAPIDMLSYITLHPEDWQKHSYIAMNGVYESAVLKALELHDNIEHIIICTDNDEGGIDAYDRLNDLLQERGYANVTRIYPTYKDYNEDLKAKNGQPAIIAVSHERKHIYNNSVDALNYYPCRPDKLSSQLKMAYKNGQYRYLAEYALAGSAFFMRVKDESKAHSALKAKLRKEYRAYKDKARLDVKCRDLSSKLKEVLNDLKQPARTYEQSIATAKRLYELADCAVKAQTQEELDNQQTEEMTENEGQDEEAELSPLPSLA